MKVSKAVIATIITVAIVAIVILAFLMLFVFPKVFFLVLIAFFLWAMFRGLWNAVYDEL